VYKDESKEELTVNHILKKNQRIPCENTRTFVTRYENQIDIALPILQGESIQPNECTLLEEMQLGPLPFHLPKGTPVHVTLRFNKNNVLEVFAECQGVKKQVEVKNAKTHTEKEIMEMGKHLDKVTID
jgi:molecular chaperone DnaK